MNLTNADVVKKIISEAIKTHQLFKLLRKNVIVIGENIKKLFFY